MKLVFEYGGYLQFTKQFQKIVSKYTSSSVGVDIYFKGKANTKVYYYLLHHKVSAIGYKVNAKFLRSSIVYLANKQKLTLSVDVNSKLSAGAKRNLNKITVPVAINDATHLNSDFYSNSNKFVLDDGTNNACACADVTNIAFNGAPTYSCAFQSCLGKTLYIAKSGKISFCPKYVSESEIDTIDGQGDYFESEIFNKVIDKEIAKRDECKTSCKYFAVCHGGCAMQNLCETFKTSFESAIKLKSQLANSETDIATLPANIQYAVLNSISKGKLN